MLLNVRLCSSLELKPLSEALECSDSIGLCDKTTLWQHPVTTRLRGRRHLEMPDGLLTDNKDGGFENLRWLSIKFNYILYILYEILKYLVIILCLRKEKT